MKKNYLKTSNLLLDFEKNLNENVDLIDVYEPLSKKLLKKNTIFYENIEDNINYTLDLKNRILPVLVDELKLFHKMDLPDKFWFFLIDQWLINFLHVTYDRWLNLNAKCKNNNFYTKILNIDKSFVIPNEINYSKRFFKEDLWNHYIYGEIIKFTKIVPFEIIYQHVEDINKKIYKNYLNENSYKQKLYDSIFFLSKFFYNSKKEFKILFINNLNIKFQFKVYLKYNQFPTILKFSKPPKSKNLLSDFRNKELNFKKLNYFESFISKIILNNLPKTLIENFNIQLDFSKNFYSRFKSKTYFISQMEIADSARFFVASETTKKKILYQHGGGYGLLKYQFREISEINVSDYYFTFGWNSNNAQINLNQHDKKNN